MHSAVLLLGCLKIILYLLLLELRCNQLNQILTIWSFLTFYWVYLWAVAFVSSGFSVNLEDYEQAEYLRGDKIILQNNELEPVIFIFVNCINKIKYWYHQETPKVKSIYFQVEKSVDITWKLQKKKGKDQNTETKFRKQQFTIFPVFNCMWSQKLNSKLINKTKMSL